MKKQKENYICAVCKKTFKTARGLEIHKGRQNHWGTSPKELERHVNYIDLVNEYSCLTWGQNLTKNDAKHPTIDALKLSLLFNILREFKKLNNIFNHKKI